MWANYSPDQKNFTGHMFNIKLEEKSHKMSFTALPVKIQQSKNRQSQNGTMCPPPPGAVRVKKTVLKRVTHGIIYSNLSISIANIPKVLVIRPLLELYMLLNGLFFIFCRR